MKRFQLIGSFENCKVATSSGEDKVIVSIPFLTEEGIWMYGIENEIVSLRNYNIFPSELGFDLITLATMVYMADTRISRALHAQDSWTRELELVVPVWSKECWKKAINVGSIDAKVQYELVERASEVVAKVKACSEVDSAIETDKVSFIKDGKVVRGSLDDLEVQERMKAFEPLVRGLAHMVINNKK